MDHNQAIPLTSDKIKNYLKNLRSDRLSADALNQILDLSKEFRSKDYPLIHLLLQNPLAELISSAVPKPADCVENPGEGTVPGFLYLFDSRVPIERRRADDIRWNESKKMSVKLIIFNQNTSMYKLKNNKNDEGAVVMRRQTWRADADDKGWRRNEYKLVVKETYFKQASDGRLSVTEGQSLQEFPVLVHYFWKKSEASGHPRKKRKRADSSRAEDESAAEDPPERHPDHSTAKSPSVPQSQPPASSLSPAPALSSVSHSTSASPSVGPLHSGTKREREVGPSTTSDVISSSSLTSEVQDPRQSGIQGDEDDLLFSSNFFSMSRGSMSRLMERMPPGFLSSMGSSSQMSPFTFGGRGGEWGSGASFSASSPPSYYGRRLSIKAEPEEEDLLLSSDIVTFTSRVENGTLVPFVPVPLSAISSGDGGSSRPAEIRSYAPENGPSTEYTKMLLVYNCFRRSEGKVYRFCCLFEEVSVPCTEIAPNIVQCHVPPHKPGIVYFWLACIEEGVETVDFTTLSRESDSGSIQYSQPVPFYYAPTDPSGRLSLAWELAGHNDVMSVMKHFKYTVRELDLSNNSLGNIDFLDGFRELHTLILDHNHLTHDTKFPPMPKLRTLSINHNWLIEINKFMDNLSVATPNIRYLSTLHNTACPFFSSAKHHYYNYRIYILSRLRKLTHLDSSPVTMEEWRHAECIMSKMENSSPDQNSRSMEVFNLDEEL